MHDSLRNFTQQSFEIIFCSIDMLLITFLDFIDIFINKAVFICFTIF